jgi:hypothetical protein
MVHENSNWEENPSYVQQMFKENIASLRDKNITNKTWKGIVIMCMGNPFVPIEYKMKASLAIRNRKVIESKHLNLCCIFPLFFLVLSNNVLL